MVSVRRSLPSAVSFANLICGMLAIVLAVEGELWYAGALILLGYLLDGLDGILARRLGVASDFGIQLDSLVDIVNFGAASAILVIQHLRIAGLRGWAVWIPVLLFVMAGAYRLARFNLYAPKGKTADTLGLTISTSGAFVTLAVLSNLSAGSRLFPAWAFIPLLIVVAGLMASRIRFPEFNHIIRHRWASVGFLSACFALTLVLQPVIIWFSVTTGYISFGLARAVVRSL